MRHLVILRFAIALCTIIAFASTAAVALPRMRPSAFARDVKPLLARRCFSCHGPTAREGGLRLDKPDTALAELDSGLHAIVPGHVDQSALIDRAVSAADESERMPPEGKPLSSKEIETLKQWIAAGAKWEKHWAFVPPQPHAPPAVKNKAWVREPDRCVHPRSIGTGGPRSLLRRRTSDRLPAAPISA